MLALGWFVFVIVVTVIVVAIRMRNERRNIPASRTSGMSYREELIQVAAVVVSMIEDLDTGVADWNTNYGREVVIHDIEEERIRQQRRWEPVHHEPADWFLILMEEVGEAATAWLERDGPDNENNRYTTYEYIPGELGK